MVHKEPKKNKRKYAPKPAGYGTTKQDLIDGFHHKKAPIQEGYVYLEQKGWMNYENTAFFSDTQSVDWWKSQYGDDIEWTLYKSRNDVTGACEMTTADIIAYDEPYSYKSMSVLFATYGCRNTNIWIPDKIAPAIITGRGWTVILTPIRCKDFDRLDAVREDLRHANRSAVHVRRRTVLLEEANDFGEWFS